MSLTLHWPNLRLISGVSHGILLSNGWMQLFVVPCKDGTFFHKPQHRRMHLASQAIFSLNTFAVVLIKKKQKNKTKTSSRLHLTQACKSIIS